MASADPTTPLVRGAAGQGDLAAATRSGKRGASRRIALVGPVPPSLGGATPGGVASHQLHLATALHDLGAEVALLATNAVASAPGAWRASGTPFPVFRAYQPARVAEWLAPSYLAAVGPTTLARYLRAVAWGRVAGRGSRQTVLSALAWYHHFLETASPALLHVQHPLERHLYARLVLELDRRSTPLVVTLHSFFGEHPDHVIRDLMAPNLRHADRMIAVAPHVAEQAIQLGADPARVRVIRSGVDVQRFQPRPRLRARAQLGIDPAQPLILFVGNLEPRKAVHRLVRVLPRVRQEVPGARLVVVGSGESAGALDQLPTLKQLVSGLALGDAVVFLGRVTEDDLQRWYAAADIFALPSTSEAQGIAALEAMACGLPVVASAVGGLVGTVEDGVTGFLVPEGDETALSERLAQLLRDADLRGRLGRAARCLVERDFSWRRAAGETLAVYREVAEV